MKVRAHVYVTGVVQGVFFRFNTRTQAKMNGVTGWVRNLSDGRVEAVIEGDKGKVDQVIDFLRQGPPGSSVEDLDISWEKPSHRYTEFEIRAD